jgi:hypothetical protein
VYPVADVCSSCAERSGRGRAPDEISAWTWRLVKRRSLSLPLRAISKRIRATKEAQVPDCFSLRSLRSHFHSSERRKPATSDSRVRSCGPVLHRASELQPPESWVRSLIAEGDDGIEYITIEKQASVHSHLDLPEAFSLHSSGFSHPPIGYPPQNESAWSSAGLGLVFDGGRIHCGYRTRGSLSFG